MTQRVELSERGGASHLRSIDAKLVDLPPRVPRHYRRGGQRATLQEYPFEVPCWERRRGKKMPSYRHTYRLVLIDDDGRHMTDSWRSNATSQSHNEITALGWEEIP